MSLVVFGAHGKIGQLLVQQAAAASLKVTAVVRNQLQAARLAEHGATSSAQLTVDLASVSELANVIRGHQAVVVTVGSGGKDLLSVDLDGVVKTFEASVLAQVRRLILVSALHADKREYVDKSPIRNYYISKHYADRVLVHEFGSRLDYTILRPTALTDGEGTGLVRIVNYGDPNGQIDRADVAHAILAVLPQVQTFGKAYDFAGGDVSVKTAFK